MAESSNKLTSRRRDARLKAAETRGRLIVDDDGDLVFTEAAAAGPEPFLEQRLYPLDAVDVKSVAWCIMWGIAVGKGQTSYWPDPAAWHAAEPRNRRPDSCHDGRDPASRYGGIRVHPHERHPRRLR